MELIWIPPIKTQARYLLIHYELICRKERENIAKIKIVQLTSMMERK
jgi:hypothetical protein